MAALPPHRRGMMVLCLASAGWAFSFGLAVPLGALTLRDAGCSASAVGFDTSLYYLGVVLMSLLLPVVFPQPGRRVIVVGMTLDGVATMLFPWAGGLVGWSLLRLFSGAATALCLIPMETRVNRDAPPGQRAWAFGLYASSVAFGLGLGPLIGLPLYPHAPHLVFVMGGVVALLAAVLVAVALPPSAPPVDEEVGEPFRWRALIVLSLGTAWAQGFLEGGMLTFMSPWLLGQGYGEGAASGLLAAMFLGVFLVQLPGACLADRLGRTRFLLLCHAVVLAGLFCLPWCQRPFALASWLFLIGACCAILYPLGLALLGERLPGAALVRGNAWYLACNCAGSLSGPWMMGAAIDLLGNPGLFAVGIGAVVLVVAVWGTWALVEMRKPGGDQGALASRQAA
jgi:MFS family permease